MRGIQGVGVFAFFPIRKWWFLILQNFLKTLRVLTNQAYFLLCWLFTHLNLQFPQTKYLQRCRVSQPAHFPGSVWQTLSDVLAMITVSALKTSQSALFSRPSTTTSLSDSQRTSRNTSSATVKCFRRVWSKVLKSKLPPCWQTAWKIYADTVWDIVWSRNYSMYALYYLQYSTPSQYCQNNREFHRVARSQ